MFILKLDMSMLRSHWLPKDVAGRFAHGCGTCGPAAESRSRRLPLELGRSRELFAAEVLPAVRAFSDDLVPA
ncbi:putative protein OS=Streptomyces aurantiogriseus OX=66870 GN=GCM10010251_25960 PE=4 SV=1 [Streptomyces aurantiogriseus]|uniref:Uncharacterized protein n=1 Tax=Streptomyces aurantiogriseus TaxID=66870 RepID=A0A918F7N7_9ACTN|nr:hypothetical protein GCM10010251_25960 [Streptomyces aurantiogriseus]